MTTSKFHLSGGSATPPAKSLPQAATTSSSLRAALRRPYTKKKNAANPTNKSVPPNIHTSYERIEVICAAGKKASAMPMLVVTSPLAPANSSVGLLYRVFVNVGAAEILSNAPNIYKKGTNCSTTASDNSF